MRILENILKITETITVQKKVLKCLCVQKTFGTGSDIFDENCFYAVY